MREYAHRKYNEPNSIARVTKIHDSDSLDLMLAKLAYKSCRCGLLDERIVKLVEENERKMIRKPPPR